MKTALLCALLALSALGFEARAQAPGAAPAASISASGDCPAGADSVYCELARRTGGSVVMCPSSPKAAFEECMARFRASALSAPQGTMARMIERAQRRSSSLGKLAPVIPLAVVSALIALLATLTRPGPWVCRRRLSRAVVLAGAFGLNAAATATLLSLGRLDLSQALVVGSGIGAFIFILSFPLALVAAWLVQKIARLGQGAESCALALFCCLFSSATALLFVISDLIT